MIKPSSSNAADNTISFVFNAKPEEIQMEFANLMIKEGYKLVSGTADKGIYGKGSQTMLFLLGAFTKFFRFPYEIKDVSGQTVLKFDNGNGTKYAGGAIGVAKHKKEFQRICELIK